jgi:MFS family permease
LERGDQSKIAKNAVTTKMVPGKSHYVKPHLLNRPLLNDGISSWYLCLPLLALSSTDMILVSLLELSLQITLLPSSTMSMTFSGPMRRKLLKSTPSCAILIHYSGAVVSVFTGGAFFGAMFAGPIGDWLGRRKTIMMGAIIFCLGGGLQTGAQNLGYLYAGRAIAGLG